MKPAFPQVVGAALRSADEARAQIERLVLRFVQANQTGEIVVDATRAHPDWLMNLKDPWFELRIDPKVMAAAALAETVNPARTSAPEMLDALGALARRFGGLSFRERGIQALGDRFARDQTEIDDVCRVVTSGQSFLTPSPPPRRLFASPPPAQGEPFNWTRLAQSGREGDQMLDLAAAAGLLFRSNDGGIDGIATAAEAVAAGDRAAIGRAAGETLQASYRRHVLSDIDQLSALLGGIVHGAGATITEWRPKQLTDGEVDYILRGLGFSGVQGLRRLFVLDAIGRHRVPPLPKRGRFAWIEAAWSASTPPGRLPVRLTIAALLNPIDLAGAADKFWAEAFKRCHDAFVKAFAAGHLQASGAKPDGSGEITLPADFWTREDASLDLANGDFYVAGRPTCLSVRVISSEMPETDADRAKPVASPKLVTAGRPQRSKRLAGGANANGKLTPGQCHAIIALIDSGLLREDLADLEGIEVNKKAGVIINHLRPDTPAASAPISRSSFDRVRDVAEDRGLPELAIQVKRYRDRQAIEISRPRR